MSRLPRGRAGWALGAARCVPTTAPCRFHTRRHPPPPVWPCAILKDRFAPSGSRCGPRVKKARDWCLPQSTGGNSFLHFVAPRDLRRPACLRASAPAPDGGQRYFSPEGMSGAAVLRDERSTVAHHPGSHLEPLARELQPEALEKSGNSQRALKPVEEMLGGFAAGACDSPRFFLRTTQLHSSDPLFSSNGVSDLTGFSRRQPSHLSQ